MDEFQQDPQKVAAQELVLRELQRRSLDRIRIYNPLDEDYICYWDGYGNRFPSKKISIYFRYIAEKAMKEIIDKILTDRATKDISDMQKKRKELGQPLLSPRERSEIEGNADYKISEKALRRPLVKEIWKGIEEEYGMDKVLPAKEIKKSDTRPIDEQLIEEIDQATMVEQENTIQKNIINADWSDTEGVRVEEPPKQPPEVTTLPRGEEESLPEERKEHRGPGRPKKIGI